MKSIYLIPALLAGAASAHPVSYEGAYQLMLGGTESVQNLELYHSYTAREAFGLHVMRFEDDRDTDLFAGIQHNWLLKRWNLPSAQANVYVGLGAGGALREGDSWAPAGIGFFRADYETRRIYTAFETKLIGSEDVSRGWTAASVGFAPYEADFDELNTWFIVRFEHVSGMRDDLDVVPYVRLFKDNYFLELGCSLDGEPSLSFMVHF
ncbi:conserved hypothetical protein [Haloferula helveola]|uniref:Uncharacterized protein n=1 Tax=Haloferula helveola TaxID=490095 RepID=A0ABM7RCJ4_9BACT|nr:conserved hypothetical protein [Haloferula helveola]